MNETISARLARAKTVGEIENLWKAVQQVINLPDLRFVAKGNDIIISVDPRHGGRVPIQEIKWPFQNAIHTKYGAGFSIEWNDGPVSPLRFSNRSLFGRG
jgi:hypothetical protein